MRSVSLRAVLAATVVGVALATFAGVEALSSSVYEDALREQAEQTADATAEQTFSSMYQVMRRGWDRADLEAFIAALEKSYEETPLQVTIYRGERVDALYGTIEDAAEPGPEVERTFATGEEQRRAAGTRQRYLMPVAARQECLDCHTNAEAGDVLGVIEVSQDLAPALAQARQGYDWLLLALVPIAVLVAAGAAHLLNLRLTRSLVTFRDQVERVNAIQDLQDFHPQRTSLGFIELDRVMAHVERLMERLRAIAADRAVLDAHQRRLEAEQETAERIVSRATASEVRGTPGLRHSYQPAAILGGDVFLAERCRSGRLCLLLGDFTGHGIGSAVGVPALAALFHDQVRRGATPAELLETLNEQLYRHLPPEIFLAATLIEIDLAQGHLGIWNGGMPPTWLLRQGAIQEQIPSAGLPLAAVPSSAADRPALTYRPIEPGLEVFTCSDGVTEAPAGDGASYGIEGLEATLAQAPPGQSLEAVLAALERLRTGAEPGDDASLVAVDLDRLATAEAADHPA